MWMKKAKKKVKRTRVQSSVKDAPDFSVRDRRKKILRDLVRGVLFIVLVLAVKLGIEHSPVGKRFELLGFDIQQGQLLAQSVPVEIVDISDVPVSEETIDGVSYRGTSRKTLRDIIDALAEQEPVAIGVDLDLSPDDSGYITPRDPEFFQYCLDRGLPIFLGIRRTQLLPPAAWLNSEQYAGLAASITIPRQDTKKMPRSIQSGPQFPSGKTMSAALAGAFGESHCMMGSLLERMGLAEQVSTKEIGKGGSVGEFLVDYSPLEKLTENRTVATSADAIRARRIFRNKIIIIGDATPGTSPDAFVVDGRTEPVPGVYVHACAAYTLAVAPLYELKWQGRVAIDVLLALSILLMITGVRLWFTAEPAKVATRRLEGLLTLLIVLAAVLFGVLFVRWTCIMWSDFILALGAIALHPSIARWLESLGRFIKKTTGSFIRRLVLEQDEGENK
jgi:CHASE2 domain-containing sensor protein